MHEEARKLAPVMQNIGNMEIWRMPDFGTLRNIDLRKIWPHEANNFTPWLAENIEALGEAVGMELELTESEADVGDFSLDLLAKDLGTGLVDFPSWLNDREINLCWRFGERRIRFWHGLDEGFASRKPLPGLSEET